MHNNQMRIAILVNVALFLSFAFAGIVVVREVDHHTKDYALKEAAEKAYIIMDRNLATHSYFASKLKPGVFKLAGGKGGRLPEDYFDPTWMSSTYAVREIDKIFRTMDQFSNYYYKEAAINARTPANEADQMEREFLERLNSKGAPGQVEEHIEEVREINGEPYFVVMQKGETLEEGCLICHSTPEEAPKGLVDFYGPERAFGRHAGMVVSALSIRIPLKDAFTQARHLSTDLKRILIATLGALMVAQLYLVNWLKRRNDRLKQEVDSHAATSARLSVALTDKDMLMREVHHRVKNSLAVLSSLLSLQSHKMEDADAKRQLMDSEARIRAISILHEAIYKSEDLKRLEASSYLRTLADGMHALMQREPGEVALRVQAEDLRLDVDQMVPLGLITCELITNAMKHAFPEGRRGTIEVSLRRAEGGNCELRVKDDGLGMDKAISESTSTMGYRVIRVLVSQMDGRLEILRKGGTEVAITFPEQAAE